MVRGISLGLLIGLITGAVVALLLRTAGDEKNQKDVKAILSVVAELLAIPTFWFGGSWLTTRMLGAIDVTNILPFYMTSLVCTFTAIAIIPIKDLVIRTGRQSGKAERTNG